MKKVFGRLIGAEESDYVEVLTRLEMNRESFVVDRFFAVLKLLKRQKGRNKSYAIARAMLQILAKRGWSARNFVLRVMKDGAIKCSRLGLLVHLRLYCFSPLMILDDVFCGKHDGASLRKAANNLPESAVVGVLKFVASNSRSPEVVLAKMRAEDVFRENYDVDVAASHFTEPGLKFFIQFVCNAIHISVPPEARPLFLRVRLDTELAAFERGGTEIEDFYRISVGICKEDSELLAYSAAYIAGKSNPLAKFMAEMRGSPFTPSPGASDFAPTCADAKDFHRSASGLTTVIDDIPSSNEFLDQVDKAHHIAVVYHVRKGDEGKGACDLLAFRVRRRVFFFFPKQSQDFKERVGGYLKEHAKNKKVFVFKTSKAMAYLNEILEWKPTDVTDVRDLAKSANPKIGSAVADMADFLTGGYCCRGRNFSASAAIPSPMALSHIAADVSTIYDFALRFLGLRGREMRDAIEKEESRRARARERGNGSGAGGNGERRGSGSGSGAGGDGERRHERKRSSGNARSRSDRR